MTEGQRLQNWRFGQKTGSLIRAVSILAISGGATLGLLYASFWASLGGSDRSSRLNASVATPTFTQALQDWQQDTTEFLIQAEPDPELERRSVAYTAIAIAGLGTGVIAFILLERANRQLRLMQETCDRAQQAHRQALQEKDQAEAQIQQITQQYRQVLDEKTDAEAQIRQLESQVQANLRQSQDALAEKTEAEAHIQQLERQIQEISQRHQHALDEKAKVDEHIQELSQQYQHALDKEADQNADKEALIQQLEGQIQEISQQYQHVLDKEAVQKARIQQLESQIQELSQQYQHALDQKADKEAHIQRLEQEKQTWFEYIERSQSQEYEAVQEQFNQLQAEYEQLQNEHQQLQDRVNAQETQIQAYYAQYESVTATSSEAGIVLHSTERDLYDNEKRDLVLDILSRYSPNLLENSRRQHVLQDILDTNQPSHHRTTLEEDLRRLFWDYRSMKSEIRSTLTTLGFELIEDGSHYKIIFQQDSRYQITFSKTSSDRKAGRNIFGEIRRRLL